MGKKSVAMHAVIDGEDIKIGTCHPAKARILVKKNRARWKGARLYLADESEDESEAVSSETSLHPVLTSVREKAVGREEHLQDCIQVANQLMPCLEEHGVGTEAKATKWGEVYLTIEGPWLRGASGDWIQRTFVFGVWGTDLGIKVMMDTEKFGFDPRVVETLSDKELIAFVLEHELVPSKWVDRLQSATELPIDFDDGLNCLRETLEWHIRQAREHVSQEWFKAATLDELVAKLPRLFAYMRDPDQIGYAESQ